MNDLRMKICCVAVMLFCRLALIAQTDSLTTTGKYPFDKSMQQVTDWDSVVPIARQMNEVLKDTVAIADSAIAKDATFWRCVWHSDHTQSGSISMSQPHFHDFYFQNTDSTEFFTTQAIVEAFRSDSLTNDAFLHRTDGAWHYFRSGDFLVAEWTLNPEALQKISESNYYYNHQARYFFKRKTIPFPLTAAPESAATLHGYFPFAEQMKDVTDRATAEKIRDQMDSLRIETQPVDALFGSENDTTIWHFTWFDYYTQSGYRTQSQIFRLERCYQAINSFRTFTGSEIANAFGLDSLFLPGSFYSDAKLGEGWWRASRKDEYLIVEWIPNIIVPGKRSRNKLEYSSYKHFRYFFKQAE